MINWIKNRVGERTTWDGAVCVALGLMILFMAPLAKNAKLEVANEESNCMGIVDDVEI